MTQSLDDSISLICPSCGYDLRAISSERCPECGTTIDRSAMASSTIPWVHRKALGRVRAYCSTLILATFRMRRLGEEINRPVDLKEASRFRWVTVAISSAFAILVFVVAVCVNRGTGFLDLLSNVSPNGAITTVPPQADAVLPYVAGITRWIVLPLAAICWLGMVSGLAGFWFHPRAKPQWQRDRALGLSLYACAPLLWLSIAFATWAFGAILMISDSANRFIPQSLLDVIGIVVVVAELIGVVIVALCWINLLRLSKFTLHPNSPRTISLALGWPIACCISGVIAFGLFPWVAGFIWLIIDSLR